MQHQNSYFKWSLLALAFVMAFRRFGLGAVLGYLVAGALIGPEGLRLINAPEEMLHIADFGIVLLLFVTGGDRGDEGHVPARLPSRRAGLGRRRLTPGDSDPHRNRSRRRLRPEQRERRRSQRFAVPSGGVLPPRFERH